MDIPTTSETKETFTNITTIRPDISTKIDVDKFRAKYKDAIRTVFDSPDNKKRVMINEKGKTVSFGTNSCFSIIVVGSQEIAVNSHSPIKYARADAEQIRELLKAKHAGKGVSIIIAGSAPFTEHDRESDLMWHDVTDPFIRLAEQNSNSMNLMLIRLDEPHKSISIGTDKQTHGTDIDYIITP